MENKKEWIIGREGDIKTPDDNRSVGRRHARLTCGADGWFIEDMDSKAGTHVNGIPVKRKQISERDTIRLGTDYTFDLKAFMATLPMSDDDFRRQFLRLKDVYDTYNRTKLKVQSQSQGKMMLKRSLPMAAPGVVIAILGAFGLGNLLTTLAAGGLAMVAVVVGAIWASKELEKIPERIQALDEQFKLDYSCPECKKPFGSHNSWESLRRQGQCPYCRRKFNAE